MQDFTVLCVSEHKNAITNALYIIESVSCKRMLLLLRFRRLSHMSSHIESPRAKQKNHTEYSLFVCEKLLYLSF